MKITSQGLIQGSVSDTLFLKQLAQDVAKVYADTFTNLTDNSSGLTSGAISLPTVAGLSNTAADGTNLAQKASTETQLAAIKDAFQEIATRTIALHTKLGLGAFTYSGGGASANGTIDAVSTSITGATTGVSLANLTTLVTAYNGALAYLASKINMVATATGTAVLDTTALDGIAIANPAALSTDTGTAVAPSLTAVDVGTVINFYQDNIGRMATKLNAITTLGNAQTSVVK